jgi:hypothetical protein
VTKTVAVFGASRSLRGDPQYETAVRCGRLLAEAGFGVATGGYAGAMEAVSKGATSVGGSAIGITAPEIFANRSTANEFITHEHPVPTLTERIGMLIESTDASIALWGSIGTATELLVAWNVAYVSQFSSIKRKPVVAVGHPWTTIIPTLEQQLATEPGLVTVAVTVEDAVDTVVNQLR